jgi:hypothetical protein
MQADPNTSPLNVVSRLFFLAAFASGQPLQTKSAPPVASNALHKGYTRLTDPAFYLGREKYLSLAQLQNVLELLRIQPTGGHKPIWAYGDSIAGF